MNQKDIESQISDSLIQNLDSFKNKNPFDEINIFSRILFFWIIPLIKKAQKKDLQQEDIFNLREKDLSQFNFDKFNKIFEEIENNPKITNKIRSTFYRMYRKEIIIVAVLYLINVASLLLNLISIQLLLGAIDNDERGNSIYPLLPGICTQLATVIFASVIKSNYNFYYSLLTVRMTGALSMKIFQKTFTYPILRNQYYKIGDILNMVQVDILQIVNYIQNIIIFSFVFPFVLIALVVVTFNVKKFNIIIIMVISAAFYVALSFIFGKLYGSLQKKFMHRKDLRMRSLEEMLRGMKTIKYNSLESFFDKRIEEKREKEVQKLKNQNFLQTVNNLINNLIGNVYLLIVAFSIGINTYSEFIIINTSFNLLLSYIGSLPSSIQAIVVGRNSMQRIDHFLAESYVYEHQKMINHTLNININDKDDNSIILENANFAWKSSMDVSALQETVKLNKKERISLTTSSQNVFKIKNLNLKIKKGEFVVFCGDLGSGKTSILQGILGEMEVEGGQDAFYNMVKINGSISLSTQDPWIIQDTVKANIIFGQQFDPHRYKQALHASCFEEDLSYFVDGDSTNIGEKGDTLSGGQRKRINLARSIYKNSDIYLLDDPLSALDIGVATFIARECFQGMLKSKTRVIFVNNLLGMEKADRIFLVKNGEIIQEGKYNEIKMKLAQDGKNEVDQENEIKQSNRILKSHPNRSKSQAIVPYTKKLIKAEDIQQGFIKKDVYKVFINTLGGFKFLFACFLIMGSNIALSSLSLLSVRGMKDEDHPTQEQKDEQFKSIMFYCLYEILRQFMVFAYESLFVFTMIHLSKFLHKSIIYKLLRGSFTKFFNLITSGRLMNRLSKDIYEIDILIPKDLAAIMINISFLIFSVVMVCIICSYKVMPIVLVYILISIYLSIYFLKAKRQAVRIEATSKSPILNYLNEVVRGIFFLRNCVDYDRVKDTYQDSVDIDLRNQIAVNGIQQWFECICTFLTALPLLSCGTITYFDKDISANSAIMMSQMIQNASLSFINIAYIWIQFETHMVNYERCHMLKESIVEEEYGKTSQLIQNNHISQNEDSIENDSSIDQEYPLFNENTTSIIFKKASFQYRENLPNCLQKISLKMERNQKIGVVGRTGAGKTSITLALTRIIDLVSGELLINGKSISDYTLDELRSTISVVSQESYIFEGTLRQNLDPSGKFSNQEIIGAYSLAGFSAFSSFKNGLETEIQQLGDNLSEGEKQLISIARIILRKAKIIIVDEPTSHIDETLEEHITKILNDNFQDCLMITIAHKVKTIMESDKILVLDHGQVIEYDHPKKLLSDQNSQFSEILNLINKNKIN